MQIGTKAAAHYQLHLDLGETKTIQLRLTGTAPQTLSKTYPVGRGNPFGRHFSDVLQTRQREADAFYASITPENVSPEIADVMRQALAGMLWTKQFYHYHVETWLNGDPAGPPPTIIKS